MENMKLIVLLADILNIFQRYQKLVQSDNLTILSLVKYINALKAQLNQLQNYDLPGGWEEKFKESVLEEDGKMFLKGFEMVTTTGKHPRRKKIFNEIRCDVIKILEECLQNRFQCDFQMIDIIKPFVEFKNEANIKRIHEMFGADLSLSSLSLEYTDLVESRFNDGSSLSKLIKKLVSTEGLSSYKCVATIMSRINTCTPQSADVERCIKANNMLKTAFRNTLNLKTEIKYLYVYFNMPPLEKWDPKKSIVIWLNDKKRREHIDIIKKDSARMQRYFKGIFESTSVDSDEEGEINETTELNHVKNMLNFKYLQM